jgi:amino acid transporter
MDSIPPTAARPEEQAAPEAHGTRLRNNALNMVGNVGLALGSAAPTASIALTLTAIVAASSYASPIAILVIGLPMLGIAAAFKRLNRQHVNCGATYEWGGRAISPYYGFMVGWIIFLAYFVGVISICLPIGPYVVSLFGGAAKSRVTEGIIGSIAVVAVTIVAYIGIRIAAWVQWILITIEYIAIAVLAVFCLVAVFGHQAGSVPFTWSWFSWKSLGGVSGFIAASLTAVYMFSGWDTGVMVNEETADARETPGNAVMLSVVVLALMYAFFTFAFQGAVSSKALQSHGENALFFIARQVANSALAKYMILAVALSAVGSTLATLLSGAREAFAMGADGVLPRALGRAHPRFKTPWVATVIIGVLATAGTWIYIMGSSSVVSSFDTIVSVDGLLFALFYVFTGLAMVVYFRKMALTSLRNALSLLAFPLISAGFLAYVVWKSIPDLGGWASGSVISLYVMLGIGAIVMFYGKVSRTSAYFDTPREAYEPAAGGASMTPTTVREPR